MKRACFYLRLFPGTEAEYDRRHAAIWADQQSAIRDAGISNMSGFRRGTDVWYYAECQPDGKTAFAKLGASKANATWNDSFGPIIAELTQADGERIWFEEIFHANGGGAGPFERGVFALVVHPDRLPGDHPGPPRTLAGQKRGAHGGRGPHLHRLPRGPAALLLR